MSDLIGYPENGKDENVLLMGTTGDPPVLVTNEASIVIRGGNKIDGQTASGTNKARVKFKGQELTKIIVSFVLLPEDETNFWENTFTLLRMPGERGRALALDVTNGAINRAGVETVVIDDYEIEEADPVRGRSVVINMREWAAAVFEPKAEPNKGKSRVAPPTGPHVTVFDTDGGPTLEGTVVPR